MITKPMDVLIQFPIRRSETQKEFFRREVSAFIQQAGYDVTIESGKKGVNNIVIGDPEKAKYLITAHYDTPSTNLFPNILLPANRLLFVLYQIGIILAYFLVAAIPGSLAFALTQDKTATFAAWYVTYMTLAILPRFGPANKHNVNDNTSGVITLLEILVSMPQSFRDRVCFILFDQEEKGLVGSAAYAKQHQDAVKEQIVLNLDCVGDGDVLLMTPTKTALKNEILMERMRTICRCVGKKEILLLEKAAWDSSDHKSFPLGVGFKALHYKKGIGLYCGRIHTNRDTVLDQTNINILRAAIVSLITNNH